MMFMIPIPPTSSEIPAMMPRNTTNVFVVSSRVLYGALLADDGEVVFLGDAVAQAKHSARLLDALVDVLHVPPPGR